MKRAALLALLAAACAQAAGPAADSSMLAEGKRAYQKCYSCHSLKGPDPSTQGPSLKGVIGREVAAEAGFPYSPAMRGYGAKQRRWSREALEAFIADPQAVVPGNEMGFFGIADAQERRALIAYLAAN